MEKKRTKQIDDIAANLVTEFGMTKYDARAVVNTVFDSIIMEVGNGNKVRIMNFGMFYKKHHKRQDGTSSEMMGFKASNANRFNEE